jgi:RNA polymerase sigma-70 factor (ECF subfamily)
MHPDPTSLVRMYAPAVFGLCRAMVRDTQLAEDLSQDTFARAFASLESFRGDASPRTWLLKIARNRCLDHLDHVKRAPWGADPDPDPDAHPTDEPPPIDLLEHRDDAERALGVLGEHERALVVLHYGHGVGYAELADSFGIGQGAVRMRMSRALAKMREALMLEEHDDAETVRDFNGASSFEADLEDDTIDVDASTDGASMYTGVYDEPSPALWARLDALLKRLR